MDAHLRELDLMSATATDFLTAQETEALGLPPYSDDDAAAPCGTDRGVSQVAARAAAAGEVRATRVRADSACRCLLRVSPLDQTGQRLDDLSMIVVGKDISPNGISFFHEHPLPHRRAIVSFEHPEVGTFTMEIDLGWCQFTGTGWYVSGGKLVRSMGPAE